ncbi:MAG: HAD-IIA family hydrolase [Dermatophilus congolensis]|nr:HAD-IIA family hydrolase [Dermatophilus congolensis]
MTRLVEAYKGFICDLDGVVYRGQGAVAHAVDALRATREHGRIAYATNNAARPPHTVAEHLRELGIELDDSDVVTSSQAGARRLAELIPAGSRVLAVGGPGVTLALEESGLVPVQPRELEEAQENDTPYEQVVAVLQGFGRDVSWHDLSQASFAIQGGARWVATNHDSTLPLAHGVAPGNGSLVGAVRNTVDVDPIVVGKPFAALYEYSAAVNGTEVRDTLAIGDRLNTDIAGAVTCGMDSIYVATGVSSPIDVALVDASERPTFLAMDLRALGEEYVSASVESGSDTWTARCGDAVASWGGSLELGDGGSANERLRALVALAWGVRDAGVHLDADALAPGGEWVEAGQ